ncbi:hypothetical protein [Bacteroidetes bacterium endosymbiont of Geopemphigus sp.]|uniref:hypothetical protein n=1 Tax=Bacteroidetes bacterium endosymbiont of Geopemphigus sp. TaxID=2047937 RepID=UPI000CD0BBC4|nr:hypothetical protein [Bacteroidetes bacterium endosymbiont of Geopemphigus sp.]
MDLKWEGRELQFFKKPYDIREFYHGWKFTGNEKTISKNMRVWREPQVIKFKILAGKDGTVRKLKKKNSV